MKNGLKRFFASGVLQTGWINAAACVVLAVGVYFSSTIYTGLNHGPAVLHLQTAIDRALPVVPIFVIPYVSLEPYIYFSLVVFLIFRTRTFQSACLAMIVTFFVSYFFYYFLQTEVIRPVLTANDMLTRMIRDVYAGDNPFNDFPSLHTSTSTIIAIHWFRLDRRLGIVAAAWTALIVASTVLVKQHYIADLGAGLLLAFAASLLFMRLLPQKR
jgi:membrane-associated phospholipid phosphatase